MLLMKPNCECCDRNLAADANGAMICSFECTFCAVERFAGVCPNCGGDLSARPPRPAGLLHLHPPSSERVLKAHRECAAA